MSVVLRIVLLLVSLITAVFVVRKIRRSQVSVSDSIYWIFFCALLLILSLFPQISFFFSKLLGFESAANFIFVVFIFLLLIKVFLLSMKIAKLEQKQEKLVQSIAIKEYEKRTK